MYPIGSSRRRLLNQSTHLRVSHSTASADFHGPNLWITYVLNRQIIVSASALLYEQPTVPTLGSSPAPASRSVYLIDRYWADSTGHRNTFDYMMFEQPVECLCRCAPAEGFAGSCVQSMCDCAQLIDTVPAEICAFGEVLP